MNELLTTVYLLATNWKAICPSFLFGLVVSTLAIWAVWLNVSDVFDRHYRRRH